MRAFLARARWIGAAILAFGMAGPLGLAQAPADDKKVLATIAALKWMGARVETDTTPDGFIRVTSVAISCGNTKAALVHVESLTELSSLMIHGDEINDDALVRLKGLKKLESLSLGFTRVDDAGLVHLSGLTNLRHLDLTSTWVRDAGLSQLEALKEFIASRTEPYLDRRQRAGASAELSSTARFEFGKDEGH